MRRPQWHVYPAIDLRRGRVVRLAQGDPERQTAYADDPLAVALRWCEAGAAWIHVVNLDGALGEGGQKNARALRNLLRGIGGVNVQFGGGLRDLDAVDAVLDLGVERAVFGTAAVRNPALVEAALDTFGGQRIAVGIDALHGKARTHGWTKGTGVGALDLAVRWAARGVQWAIVTDVARDGVARGPNLDLASRISEVDGLQVIAAGGIAGLPDVVRAYERGLSGVVIGRALYEGTVALEEALAVSTGASAEHESASCESRPRGPSL